MDLEGLTPVKNPFRPYVGTNTNRNMGAQCHHHISNWVILKGKSQDHSDLAGLYLVKESN